MKLSLSVLTSLLLFPVISGCDLLEDLDKEKEPDPSDLQIGESDVDHECFHSESGDGVECDFAGGSGTDCTVYEDGSIVCSGGGSEEPGFGAEECIELPDGTVICGSPGAACSPQQEEPYAGEEMECWVEGDDTICVQVGGDEPVAVGGDSFRGDVPGTEPACWTDGDDMTCVGGGGISPAVDTGFDGSGASGGFNEEECWVEGDVMVCEGNGGSNPIPVGPYDPAGTTECWQEGDATICEHVGGIAPSIDGGFSEPSPVPGGHPELGDCAGEIIHVCLSQGLMETALADYCYSVIQTTLNPCGDDDPSPLPVIDPGPAPIDPGPAPAPDPTPPSPF